MNINNSVMFNKYNAKIPKKSIYHLQFVVSSNMLVQCAGGGPKWNAKSVNESINYIVMDLDISEYLRNYFNLPMKFLLFYV